MFTPPPSPEPPQTRFLESSDSDYFDISVGVEDTLAPKPLLSSMEAKRAVSRRTKWTVITVPLVLILITCTTRSLTHPAFLDIISGKPALAAGSPSLSGWKPHKRHPEPMPQAGASNSIVFPTTMVATSAAVPATTSAAAQAVPTIPSTAPTLPNPFPQPFESDLQANFTSLSCQSFFMNMTNIDSFRSCRPFSLLLQSSESFAEAQTNLTELNSIVWGTCNTNVSQQQCSSNMASFANELRSNCANELNANNNQVIQTLQGLQAYDLMRNASCFTDQVTNAYCFVEASHSPNPSDLYFYQLPIGIPLPNKTSATCSSCIKSLMGLYAQALESAPKGTLSDLQSTYSSAEHLAVGQCGSGYAVAATVTSGSRMNIRSLWVFIAVLFSWALLSLSP